MKPQTRKVRRRVGNEYETVEVKIQPVSPRGSKPAPEPPAVKPAKSRRESGD